MLAGWLPILPAMSLHFCTKEAFNNDADQVVRMRYEPKVFSSSPECLPNLLLCDPSSASHRLLNYCVKDPPPFLCQAAELHGIGTLKSGLSSVRA